MRQPVLMRGDPPAEQRKQLDALTQTPCLCAPQRRRIDSDASMARSA
jgi:hypothetical protein